MFSVAPNAVTGIGFNFASIASILWTNCGFCPNPEISTVAYKVLHYIKESGRSKYINFSIFKTLGVDTSQENHQLVYEPNTSKGIEHITIRGIKDLRINDILIKDLTPRIYICNNKSKIKAKITVIANVVFDDGLSSEQIRDKLGWLSRKLQIICKVIHRKIYKEFDLGPVNYISTIISVESSDKEIDAIISSKYLPDEKAFSTDEINKDKLVKVYCTLLANDRELPCRDLETIHDIMSKYRVKQSKMRIYQGREVIPAKAINYELIDRASRFIAILTKPDCGSSVTNRLFQDYLNMT